MILGSTSCDTRFLVTRLCLLCCKVTRLTREIHYGLNIGCCILNLYFLVKDWKKKQYKLSLHTPSADNNLGSKLFLPSHNCLYTNYSSLKYWHLLWVFIIKNKTLRNPWNVIYHTLYKLAEKKHKIVEQLQQILRMLRFLFG